MLQCSGLIELFVYHMVVLDLDLSLFTSRNNLGRRNGQVMVNNNTSCMVGLLSCEDGRQRDHGSRWLAGEGMSLARGCGYDALVQVQLVAVAVDLNDTALRVWTTLVFQIASACQHA
ncbi:hypothetical protein HRR83_009555 [Exophiala dermatitidis]|nr:hypothetical protein HRR74_007599 [Exophiala dermatitidis]KAJ4510259.1 hypothetical protein HRR73_007057 [Exophiala dermatitidis]KAJ4539272.1 hypothetical protein HRR77_006679 [Exophiala dermatitidis]KAJ4540448.1 hypothetical protein HRR76_003845 [Exophiala dermatitidis]KAJ4564721.1 hypothetical protein HRR79_005970 [Exophiala dermatitidis]